jgi:hypothetical protein
MPLRGKKAVVEKTRPKVVFFGKAGVGKTYMSLQFPKPYYIDTEEGMKYKQYVDLLNKGGGAQFKSADYDEILREVKTLLTEKHDYKTLVIDSISKLYNNMSTEAALELAKREGAKNPDGTAFSGHMKKAQNRLKPLFLLLQRLDMNIVLIAHSKNEWEKGECIGTTFDFHEKLAYDLDLTLEVTLFGKNKRTATIIKSRMLEFEKLSTFDFTYENFAKMYGKQYIDKDAEPEELATPEQITELTKWIEKLNISEKITNKWLDAAKASKFEEMEKTKIQACINHVKKDLEEK